MPDEQEKDPAAVKRGHLGGSKGGANHQDELPVPAPTQSKWIHWGNVVLQVSAITCTQLHEDEATRQPFLRTLWHSLSKSNPLAYQLSLRRLLGVFGNDAEMRSFTAGAASCGAREPIRRIVVLYPALFAADRDADALANQGKFKT
jgi:hypothetical protein